MQINENILKITAQVSIPEPLVVDENYTIALHGQITGYGEDSNDDGTRNATWKFKAITGEVLKSTGKAIKIKDKRKSSQKLRGRIWGIWSETQSPLSEEEFYEESMKKIINNCEQLL
jgi:hypothetical protein